MMRQHKTTTQTTSNPNNLTSYSFIGAAIGLFSARSRLEKIVKTLKDSEPDRKTYLHNLNQEIKIRQELIETSKKALQESDDLIESLHSNNKNTPKP